MNMFNTFFIITEIGFQKIFKKEHFQNSKHNRQLQNANNPKCFTLSGHRSKAIFIQLKNPVKWKENIFNHFCTAFL